MHGCYRPSFMPEQIEELLSLIEKTFPIPGRFRSKLPEDVAELSRLLTSARGERDSGYLNRPNVLSAYLRYFLPWNVFRLCRLFSLAAGTSSCSAGQGPLFDLSDGDAITDLGSGPLTLPIALWIACPQLRKLKLEFRCVDKSAAALEAGYKLFKALSAGGTSTDGSNAGGSAWKIKTIHGSITEPVRGKPAKLTAALNVFNEAFAGVYWHGNEQNTNKAAALLCNLCADRGSILVVEPGNPQGGAFIAGLRAALLEKGRAPAAPCPHAGPCPLPGVRNSPSKAKWCHFAFDTETAPPALHKLSAAAGIPKERATLSFLLTKPVEPMNNPAGGANLKRIRNNAESVALKRTPDNAENVDLKRTPDNAESVGLERIHNNAGSVVLKRIHNNAKSAVLKRTPDNAENVGLERIHNNAKSAVLKHIHNKTAPETIPETASVSQALSIRIISDTFPVLPKTKKACMGCYGCSEKGMVLVTGTGAQFNPAEPSGKIEPGTLLELPCPVKEQRDRKTGALIMPLMSRL
jgi:hypothetical protein